MDDLRAMDAYRPHTPSTLPVSMQEINTPLCWQAWDKCLAAHPDQEFRQYIVQGIRYGFRIGFNYSRSCSSATRNLASAGEQPQVIRDYLAIECASGRVLGPLSPLVSPRIHISSFGVIPKKTPGKWRLIVDLSSPEERSVNDGVDEKYCSLHYVSVDDAAKAIVAKGQGSLLAKVDIASAYRNIPIHPDDRCLLGMRWEGSIFIDMALPFGLCSAPKIFTAVADAAEWILRQEGVDVVLHYLDDYLLVGAPSSNECLNILLRVFQYLGLPIAQEKVAGPATVLDFLGLEFDTMAMALRLPPEKVAKLQMLVQSWLQRRSCTKGDLESLIGSLSHACKVVRCGKTFLRRLFELLSLVRRHHHHIRLNLSVRSDLRWWDTFLTSLNGISLSRLFSSSPCHFVFASDASGSVGCGAIWAPLWLQLKWSDSVQTLENSPKEDSIMYQELLPIILACAVWGRHWCNSSVRVYCDNMGTVSIVNSGYSRVGSIMHLLRCLFFIRARFNFHLEAVHIPGAHNHLADAISRDNLEFLYSQVPTAAGSQTLLPAQLVSLLVLRPIDWTSPDWSHQFGSCFQQV